MKDSTDRLLRKLGSRIICYGDDAVIVEVAPGVTVDVAKCTLRQWCINRLESRKAHVGRCVSGSGGYARDIVRAKF